MTGCFHCNDPVPDHLEINVQVGDEQHPVCCIGCKAAFEFVMGAGLGKFYEFREASDEGWIKPRAGGFESFDNLDVLSQFSFSHGEEEKEATVHMGNLYCSACVWLLNNVLGSIPGILDYSVNPTSHKLVVRWRQDQIPFSQILDRISSLGFVPEPIVPGTTQDSQQSHYRVSIQRLVVAAVFGMQAMMFAIGLYSGEAFGMEPGTRHLLQYASLVAILPVVFFSATPFFRGALRGLKNLSPGMDMPVALAIFMAFVISVWETLNGGPSVYYDSIAMFVLFLSLSRFLEMRARHTCEDKIQAMASLLPITASRVMADNSTESVSIIKLKVGDKVILRPGDIVPGDGKLVAGLLAVDESFMTGESQAVSKVVESTVLAGSQCLSGTATVELTQVGASTRLAEIARLLEKSLGNRATTKGWADRLATGFVMVVLMVAGLTAVSWWLIEPKQILEPVLAVLIVSCPCALALATPTVITVATTYLSRQGLLLTNSRLLEVLRANATLVFDKTGTLTQGKPQIVHTELLGHKKQHSVRECLEIAASLESFSEHVMAGAFVNASKSTVLAESAEVHVGAGVSGVIRGRSYRIGTKAFVDTLSGIDKTHQTQVLSASTHTQVFLGDEEGAIACFELEDALRPDAKETINALERSGFEILIASGDHPSVVSKIARQLSVERWYGSLSPAGKVDLIHQLRAEGKTTVMVGDGINDAPVLSAADASIALDAGTALARSSADAVVLGRHLGVLKDLLGVALRTQSIIKQNIAWAVGYNLFGIGLAAAGILTPWMAAIGMSVSSLLVLLNAMRGARDKPNSLSTQGLSLKTPTLTETVS